MPDRQTLENTILDHLADLRLAMTTTSCVLDARCFINCAKFLYDSAKRAGLEDDIVKQAQQVWADAEMRFAEEIEKEKQK